MKKYRLKGARVGGSEFANRSGNRGRPKNMAPALVGEEAALAPVPAVNGVQELLPAIVDLLPDGWLGFSDEETQFD